MNTIKIRYVVRHIASENIEVKYYYLNQIEQEPLKKLSPVFVADYKVLSKDLYTGLKDKNSVEIYEKDVLRWNVFDGLAYFNGTHKVYFDDGAFRLNRYHSVIDYINNGDVEIIGNVHEHPHLL